MSVPVAVRTSLSRKKPKTLSGIETCGLKPPAAEPRSRKKPKTLSGIETSQNWHKVATLYAGKNLKPYQGLKHKLLKGLLNRLWPEKT